jgi:hypothetical protein
MVHNTWICSAWSLEFSDDDHVSVGCGVKLLDSGVICCQDCTCGSSDIDGMVIVLLGRMMILYNSEWTIFKITALSA